MDIRYQWLSSVGEFECVHSQKEEAHLSLLPSVLANYCEKTHIVEVLVVRRKKPQKLEEVPHQQYKHLKLGGCKQESKESETIGDQYGNLWIAIM
jgi:hypothetical protein